MNTQLAQHSLIGLLALTLLVACSNSQDSKPQARDEPTASQAANDYAPDASKLNHPASSSQELYVEDAFNFSRHHQAQLTLFAEQADGRPLIGTLVSVYWLPEAPDVWVDELQEHAELLTRGQTNALGVFERHLELPAPTVHLLAHINALGSENKVLITADTSSGEPRFTHHFSQQ